MADPPASAAYERSIRHTLEPDALSPLARDECVSQLFVETAPSGCTEVSLQNTPREPHLFDDSHNVVLTVDEERDDTDTSSENKWVPPNNLNALRLLVRDSRRTPPMPMSRRNRTDSASSAGSLNGVGNMNSTQLPPLMADAATPKNRNGGGNTCLAASSSTSSGEIGSHQAAPQPSTSRTVQRMSSLKKTRRVGGGGGNALLHRLFCNSPLALGSNNHTHHDDHPEQFPTHSGSSSEENNNPLVFQARVQELMHDLSADPKIYRSKEDDDSAAGKLLKTAKEKLTLYDEAKVRESVQLSISETMLVACSAPSQESPPSFQCSSTEDSNGEKKRNKHVKLLVGDTVVGSTGTRNDQCGNSVIKMSKKLSILDDAGSIQEPNTKLSIFDDDDDIAETASQPAPAIPSQASTTPPLSEVLSKSKSREEKSKNRSNGKPMKTPGGLVIPSPFTFSARNVFPAAFNSCYPTTMPVEEEEEEERSPEPPRRKTPSRVWPPPQSEKSSYDKGDPPEVRRNRVEDYREENSASPIDLYRLGSSLEDLETVPEASTSKETATKASRTVDSGDDADGDESGPIPNSLSSLTEYDRKSTKSPFQPSLTMATRDAGPVTSPLTISSSTGSEEQTHKQQPKQQHNSSVSRRSDSFRDLKAKYERRFSEQKDQALVLGRLANQRLSEIEKLEGQMAEKKGDEDRKVRELHAKLEYQQREMAEVVEHLRKEMEAKKEAEIELLRKKMEVEKRDEAEHLRKEGETTKEKEVDSKITEMHSEYEVSPSLKLPPGELQRVKLELSKVNALLVDKQMELVQIKRSKSPVKINTGTDTLYRVTKELADLKETLARKEKKIQERDDAFIDKKEVEGELMRVKQQLEIKKNTEEELERAKRELFDIKQALASSKLSTSVISVPSEIEAELQRVKIDFSELTKKLVEKEKELETTRKSTDPRPSPERQRSPIRPYPFPFPGKRRSNETPPNDGNESLRNEIKRLKEEAEKVRLERERELAELRVANEVDLKREREKIRKQEMAFEEELAMAKREHALSLSQLRTHHDKQYESAHGDAEMQLQQQLSKQKELESTLAESCVREANERANLEHQIEQLRLEKTVAQSEVKRAEEVSERPLDQITTLEKKQTKMLEDHVRSMQDLRTQNLQEIEDLREKMQKDAQEREIQERDRLQATEEAHRLEKESLTSKVVALEVDLENERKGASLVDTRFGELENKVEAEKQRHRKEVDDLQTKSNAEIERLKEELEDRMALEEAMQIATNERDDMREQVHKLKSQINESTSNHLQILEGLQEELNDTKTRLEKAIERNTELEVDLKHQLGAAEENTASRCQELRERLQREIDDLKQQLNKAKEVSVSQCKVLCENHQKEIEVLKKRHDDDDATFRAQVAESNALLQSMKHECDKKIKHFESELLEKELSYKNRIDEAELIADAQEQKLRAEYSKLKNEHVVLERRMKEAEVNHNKQFEDLLSQLDLVVAEHRESLSTKDKAILEKEDVIARLSKALADSHQNMTDNEQRLISQMEETEKVQHKSESLQQKVLELNEEIESLRETQKKFAREAAREKERACNIAREEMIERAEAQFQQANDHYIKLRKQYDDVHDRAKKLEGELRISKRRAEKLAHEKESFEVDLNAEIAKLKSANAKIEADSAQKAKEYRRELERLLQTAKDFESKSEESEFTVRHFQTMLATTVAEKDKLRREYDEMKSVSEELMAIVEGQNIGQVTTHEV